jgi:methyl-accepting chemotaxis protein
MSSIRLGVQGKLLGAAAVTLALLVVVGLVGITALSSVSQKADEMYADATAPMTPLATARAKQNQQVSLMYAHVLAPDAGKKKALEATMAENKKTIDAALAEVEPTLKTQAGKDALRAIRSAADTLREARDPVLGLSRQGRGAEAYALAQEEVEPAIETVLAAYRKLQDSKTKLARTRTDEIHETYAAKRSLSLVLIVAAFAAGLLASWWIARSIKRQVVVLLDRFGRLKDNCITDLNTGLDRLAEGDLTFEVVPSTPPIETMSSDEIGDVARAFNEIREKTVASLEGYNSTRSSLSDLIRTVSDASQSVAGASQQMASTSDETGKAVGEIAQAVGEVAAGAERQVQAVVGVRALAEQSAAASAESAQAARDSSTVAGQAREVAQEGARAVEEATRAMGVVRDGSEEATAVIRQLGEKSGQIGGIVDTITAIAEQTNLLALNAAIEAARAGEQGRGFAVVAEEVRKLAEESQEAAQQIAGLIGAIQGETTRAVEVVEAGAEATQSGVATVEQARQAFAQLTASVEEIDERARRIAAAVEQIEAGAADMQHSIAEVAAVAEQSSASTQQVSASTEQTSASTQQIAASAQELAGRAEELATLVGRFTVA